MTLMVHLAVNASSHREGYGSRGPQCTVLKAGAQGRVPGAQVQRQAEQ